MYIHIGTYRRVYYIVHACDLQKKKKKTMTAFYYFYANRNNTNIRVIYMHLYVVEKRPVRNFPAINPQKKDFLRIYTYTLYIFYPRTIALWWQIYLFSYPTAFIYMCVSAYTCVCERFFFSIYRLQEIESDFVCVHARPLRPIKRNTIFST